MTCDQTAEATSQVHDSQREEQGAQDKTELRREADQSDAHDFGRRCRAGAGRALVSKVLAVIDRHRSPVAIVIVVVTAGITR